MFAFKIFLVPSSWLIYPTISNESEWKTEQYNLITHSKLNIVYQLLSHNFTVFLTDIDVAWLSPHIVQYIDYLSPTKDFIYTTDDNRIRVTQDDTNTGFYIVRPNIGGKKIFEMIISNKYAHRKSMLLERQKIDKENDQFVANRVFKKHPELLKEYGFSLDKLRFTNGLMYHNLKLHERFGIEPLTFHANYFVGFEKKKKALVDHNMWFIGKNK